VDSEESLFEEREIDNFNDAGEPSNEVTIEEQEQKLLKL
jgi:hypothetical protein